MERNSLGDSPEVIKLFETMEQNRLYVEKARMEEIVAHIDELLTTFDRMEKELADLRQQAGGEGRHILDEGAEAVQEAKTVVERVKDTIRDTAGRAAKFSRSALVSTLHAAHIPALLEKVQSVLHDTELRMRRSAHKAEIVSSEIHAANVYLGNVGRTVNGKAVQQPRPVENKGMFQLIRAGFLGLANTFERMSGATARLRAKIPDLNKAAQGRESVRARIQGLKRQSAPGRERQATEVEI